MSNTATMAASVTTRQLQTLLAMPTALRPVLLGASYTTQPCARMFSSSRTVHAVSQLKEIQLFTIPEFRQAPITDIPLEDVSKAFSLLSAPDKPLEDELNRLFTANPAAFMSAGSNFYKLEKNTRMPEVCILGRSNVGKSSLVNALANRSSSNIAKVSKKAGKTKSINMYGFGPAPTMKELAGQAAIYKGKEDIPKHTFRLVDMPGYGHGSQAEWGENISLYLRKRDALKGAILLIDANVGPKDSDWHMLELLNKFQLKTTIILTKADKAKAGVEGLRATCKEIWDGIHDIERKNIDKKWPWDRDIYLSAAGSTSKSKMRATVTLARLAVARAAGLVKDNRHEADKDQKWSGKMVSFGDLDYVPSSELLPKIAPKEPTTPIILERTEPTKPTPDSPHSQWSIPIPKGVERTEVANSKSSFDQFEAAFLPAVNDRNHNKSKPARTKAVPPTASFPLTDVRPSSIARPAARIRPPPHDPKAAMDAFARFEKVFAAVSTGPAMARKRGRAVRPKLSSRSPPSVRSSLQNAGAGKSSFAKFDQNLQGVVRRHYSTTNQPAEESISGLARTMQLLIALKNDRDGPTYGKGKLTHEEHRKALDEFVKTVDLTPSIREKVHRHHLDQKALPPHFSDELIEKEAAMLAALEEQHPEDADRIKWVREQRLEIVAGRRRVREERAQEAEARSLAAEAQAQGWYTDSQSSKVAALKAKKDGGSYMSPDEFNTAFQSLDPQARAMMAGPSKREKRKEKKAKKAAKQDEEDERQDLRRKELDDFEKMFEGRVTKKASDFDDDEESSF
ncbi:hypothetical protein F5Y16DRAFT_227030 [Xylariaceae sp. FL0255]|nr:hypothetical protein F5Y16DRAFT_227030 [Xylariaceae sp. FL0255]